MQLKDRRDIIGLIGRGYFDMLLPELGGAVEERQRTIRKDVMAKVKEVYGPDAVIAREDGSPLR